VPIGAGSIGLIVDVLGGMFCALERPRVAVDLAPGIRSTGAVARGNALAIASTDIGGRLAIARISGDTGRG
jgi:hypothetical protein